MLRLITVYQRWISPWLPPHCRFYPTCSEYAAEAIRAHGKMKGTGLAVKRICRCHPLSAGGFDPVPANSDVKGSGQGTAKESRPPKSTPSEILN